MLPAPPRPGDKFQPGDKVRVTTGPLTGFLGLVEGMERISVSKCCCKCWVVCNASSSRWLLLNRLDADVLPLMFLVSLTAGAQS